MLLGITEFKVYLQIKDNPMVFVDLLKLSQNSKMRVGEVAEVLKIANGYLPRVKLEYDRLHGELNSWKAAISNEVRIYQSFCDRNLALKNREDELQRNIDARENKKAELQKTIAELEQHLELHENDTYRDNSSLEGNIISTNALFVPSSNKVIDYYHDQNQNETLHQPSQVEQLSRTLVFDTKDLY